MRRYAIYPRLPTGTSVSDAEYFDLESAGTSLENCQLPYHLLHSGQMSNNWFKKVGITQEWHDGQPWAMPADVQLRLRVVGVLSRNRQPLAIYLLQKNCRRPTLPSRREDAMTAIYEVGKVDVDDPKDVERFAELFNRIPKGKLHFRPVPTSYKVASASDIISDEVRDDLIEKSKDAPPYVRYCRACWAVVRDMQVFSFHRDTTPEESGEYIAWDVRLEELTAAAEWGCGFCGLMAVRFFNDTGLSYVWTTGSTGRGESGPLGCCAAADERDPKVLAAVDRLKKFSAENPGAVFNFIAQPVDYEVESKSWGKMRFQVVKTNCEAWQELLGFRREMVIEFYGHPGDERNNYLRYAPPNLDPGDKGSCELAMQWINNCTLGHRSCPRPLKSTLPTRVVQILDAQNLRIVSSDEVAYYVTLSYCWGGPQTFATTLDTLEEKSQGFVVSHLPQTLQDAVKVTREFGFEYLWIDSLCILQDSEEDKVRELPQMANYYKRSAMTIAAGPKFCTSGFLEPGKVCQKHDKARLLRNMLGKIFWFPDARGHMCLFREETPYWLTMEPIHSRAWTFQERVLSPRVLFYGSRMVWQCNTCQLSDGGVDDWSYDVRSMGNARLAQAINPPRASPDSDKKELYALWYTAVHEYSYRALSFPQDKLPALSGLAAEFQSLTSDAYLAGLWRADFLRGLLWSTYPTMKLKKPQAWRAPSWSWASVDNAVEYRLLPAPSAVPLTEVVSCVITPKHPAAPLGELSAAQLTLRGPLLRPTRASTARLVRLENHIPEEQDDPAWRAGFMDLMTREWAPQPNSEVWEPPEGHALLLLLASPGKSRGEAEAGVEGDGGHWYSVSGLILVPAGEGKWERVGCFTKLEIKVVGALPMVEGLEDVCLV